MRRSRVYVAGHNGLVGSSLVRCLHAAGYPEPITRSRTDLDLTDQRSVKRFLAAEAPDAIVLAAARVGGIHANNTYRWDFIYQNLAIELNVIAAALDQEVERVVFLGSSCVYPRLAPQPISEEALLSGPLEQTNEPYAVAKIAGLKLIEAAEQQFGRRWASLMPTNLYGRGDNFRAQDSHVIPALIRKFDEALSRADNGVDPGVTLWGSGTAQREFLHVDDLAMAAIFMLENDATGLYNVGSGVELTIRELADLIKNVVGYKGQINWDTAMPDGTPRKLLDSSKIAGLGWSPKIPLLEGLTETYQWYKSAGSEARR